MAICRPGELCPVPSPSALCHHWRSQDPREKIKEANQLQSQGRGSLQAVNLKDSGKMENLSDAIRGILTAWTLIIEFHQKVKNFSEHQRVIYFQRVGAAQTNPMSPLQVNLEPAMPQSVPINLREDLSVYLWSH